MGTWEGLLGSAPHLVCEDEGRDFLRLEVGGGDVKLDGGVARVTANQDAVPCRVRITFV